MGELNISNFIYIIFFVMLGFDAYAKKQLKVYILYINKVAFFKRFDNQVNGIMQNTHIKK